MRVLISGGPGSGCTSTAELVGAELGLTVLDSDSFFHKPTDPPFQEQYSSEERRRLVSAALQDTENWILSGSIATWGVELPLVDVGIFLDTPQAERMRRLRLRERARFGKRIDPGGDLHLENTEFMVWASDYEERSEGGRYRRADREFLVKQCEAVTDIVPPASLEDVVAEICRLPAFHRE